MNAMNLRAVFSRLRARRALANSVVLLTLVGLLAGPVAAQQYKSTPPKMNLKASKTLRTKMDAAMRNAATFAEPTGKKSIDDYFNTYYFPRMTQYSPSDLANLGKAREALFKRYLRSATVPAAKAHLTKTTLNVMRKIARDNYHPAVRYNATLILGMLDQKYAGSGANSTPPVALPAGTNELLELLEKKDFNGVPVHPSVKVGALEGLERHLRFGLDPQYSARVTQAAMAVLAQEASDLDVDADVDSWIKCQAASVLAQQFKDGPNAEVLAALTKLIANDKMSLESRCCVVGLLKNMKFAGAADAGIASTIVPLGNLTQAVVSEGAEKAQEFEDLMLGNNPGLGRQGGGYGGRRGEEGPKFERRQLLSRMISITTGANALSEGLPEEEKQKVQSLTELLNPVITSSLDRKVLDLDVTSEVIKLNNTINTIVASWQPAKAAAEAADVEFTE